MHNTFDYCKGHLCLKSVDTMYAEPTLLTLWYPFFPAKREDIAHLIGKEAWCFFGPHSGFYTSVGSADTHTYALQDRGTTKPIHAESTPVPCPRVRKGIRVRWESGRWQKLLKSGWVTA
jgi:hypothetical protein